jgi:hypothetical protein
VIPIGSTLGKTAFILTIATLIIGSGSALTWDNPGSSDEEFDSTIDLNISGVSQGDSVVFKRKAEGDDSYTEIGTVSADSNGEASESFSIGDLAEKYSFRANNTASGGGIENLDNILLDGQAPSVTFPDNLGYVGSDPTITVELDDSDTGVDSADASISDGDAQVDNVDDGDCDESDSCEVDIEIDTSDMDDGDQFELEVTPEDGVGNSATSNEGGIELDDSYDGDSSADVEWDVSGDTTLVGNGDDDQDVLISFQPDSVSETTVTCFVDDEEVDADTLDASNEEEEAICELGAGEYAGSIFDLTIEVEDAAGNEDTIVDNEELVWDERPPAITTIENPKDISTFNDNFEISVTATDDASGVENLEYYFDSGTEEGNGNSVDLEQAGSTAVDSTFEVSPDLGQGNHTVYLRARDGTNQWSDPAEFDFEYFPNRDPEVDLQAPESVEVISGESTSFNLDIENGAPFFLKGVEVVSDSVLWNGSVSASNLEEGDSVTKTVEIDASGLEPDTYELNLQAESTGDSSTVEVIVRATEEQKSSIDDEVKRWVSRLNELNENVSSLGSLSEENQRRLDRNISEFTQKVEQARNATENGEYYRAGNYLENIDSRFTQASNTYSEVKQDYRQKQTNKYIIFTLVAVLVLGGGTAGFLFYREEELVGDSMPEFGLPEIGMMGHIPEIGLREKLSELTGDEGEEEEEVGYSFEDFT